MDKRGRFITFEGPEGAGKSTQVKMLETYLAEHHIPCMSSREPGGTEVAEQIRNIVKHHVGDEKIADETEVLLFAASRAQHVREKIIPALKNGITVICDRFFDSTMAYQGYARGQSLEYIQKLAEYAVCGSWPDITILMDIDPVDGFKRTELRQETLFVEDRIEKEHIDFHRKVREGFLKIAEMNPERVRIVDASEKPVIIHENIKRLINELF